MAADDKENPPTIEVVEKLMTTGKGCFSVYVLNDHHKQELDTTLYPQTPNVNKDARLLKGFTRLKKVVTIREDNYNKWARSSQPVTRDVAEDITLEQMESQCLGPLAPKNTSRQKQQEKLNSHTSNRALSYVDDFEEDWKRLWEAKSVSLSVSQVPKMPPIELRSDSGNSNTSSSESDKEDDIPSHFSDTFDSKLIPINCQSLNCLEICSEMPKKVQNVAGSGRPPNSFNISNKLSAIRSQSSTNIETKQSTQVNSIHLLPLSAVSSVFRPRSKMIQLNWREAERTYQLGHQKLTSSDFAIRSKEKNGLTNCSN